MRPITETIHFEEALAMLLDSARPIERAERISIREANGRVIAEPAVSRVDVPPFDRAAMDGYAVIAEDTFGAGQYDPKTLRCIERVYTGQWPAKAITRGECIEVATGAPLPAGADAVVMVEETERAGGAGGDDIRVLTPVYPRQHVGRKGADITAGQPLLAPGDVLHPARIGALAATGVTDVAVYARPRVAILSTGNEIVDPGQPLAPGQIYDINQFTLSSIIGAHGGEAIVYPTSPDTIEDLAAAVHTTSDADVLVFSGGSSVGERDLIIDVLRRAGEVLFHGIAVKPGKPTVFGRVGSQAGTGNARLSDILPIERLHAARADAAPHRQVARVPAQLVTLPLARRVVSTTGRHQFYTVRVENGNAVPAFKASGDITSMALADGYIEIPAQTDIVEAGELVEVKLF